MASSLTEEQRRMIAEKKKVAQTKLLETMRLKNASAANRSEPATDRSEPAADCSEPATNCSEPVQGACELVSTDRFTFKFKYHPKVLKVVQSLATKRYGL